MSGETFLVKHSGRADDVRLSIDLDFNENATNRILACLSFFKWYGQEYIPVSLVGERPDLRHIVLGNISEFDHDWDADNPIKKEVSE